MDNSESDRGASVGKQAGRTSSASRSEGAEAEKGLETPPLREQTGEGLRELAARARDAITDKPEIATLSAFAVGIVTGVLLGVVLARD
jgi:hypothetical protein